MTKLLRVTRDAILLAVVALFSSASTAAIETTAWKYRQTAVVPKAGIVNLTLPPATFDTCRPGLVDLRLVDPTGRETPYVLAYARPATRPFSGMPKAFRTTLGEARTEILVETGTTEPLAAIRVHTPSPHFLKPAKVEVSDDGEHWTLGRTGTPLFRQAGAEQLLISLDQKRAAYVRITVDDARTPPIPFTGAALLLEPVTTPVETAPLPAAHISHREEFAGETVLTVDLGARNVPLAALHIGATDSIFVRKVTLGLRELRDGTATERTSASGTIYRLQGEGMPSTSHLDMPAAFTASSRELLVHIINGDSPPLAIDSITVQRQPVSLVFNAATPGAYTLLSGNPDAASANYDLSGFASTLRTAGASSITIGPSEINPDYQHHDGLPGTPLLGAVIDTSAWQFRKPVQLTTSGVHELELDLDVLADSANDLADLRLVRDGIQIPYLLERTALSRSLSLTTVSTPDAQHPTFSRWQITLPHPGLPLTRITITSPLGLFQRHLRLFERGSNNGNGDYDATLAEMDWSHSPGNAQPLVLNLGVRPSTTTLTLEADNGDNPPLTLGKVEATYPVARLLFKADPGPLALYYGNRAARVPRYDIALVATQLLAADKQIATLGAAENASAGGWAARVLGAAHAGVLFWGALGLVVVALLVVVAKLLPKPPTAK